MCVILIKAENVAINMFLTKSVGRSHPSSKLYIINTKGTYGDVV